MSDRILGSTCLVLALLYIYFALQTPVGFVSDPMGPKAFPVGIGVVLAIGAVYTLLKPDPEPVWPRLGRFGEIVFAVVVMVAYTYALPEFGFVVSTSVAAGLLSWRLGAGPLAAAVAGIGIAVAIFVIFRLVLGLSLAVGPWGF
ncbi:tripartite tricarboxylate transporter TctB family protein [Chelativorans sp. M5D2P16]|uniref:tripartite tricarboxylate transporter TctB family protein n=1 Tax=Chelativorans sp. M5D2P16 TaxID=3095678 RepID=UPI002ACACA11|nr:tripartite tricarboxylate transporter TctB family protein [Chelativorans sp. M5D2P16]MDZ5695703.1 tripartite tricarboxylate transporter TctB family protein [Chelativorans sp. M5D2P16]